MPVLTVAVLTFRRNDMLRALLPRLCEQVGELAAAGTSAEVLVVDNDPAGGASAVVAEREDPEVRYVAEPRPGIAVARERALAESSRSDALVFLDDDEVPEPGWLAHLVDTWRRERVAAVTGPVVSVYDGELDPWIVAGGFYARAHSRGLVTGDRVPAAATNNLLLDLASVRRHGLAFDTSIGLAGGEDTRFTRALVAAGEEIVWCAQARVVDRVPRDRMTRAYVVRRRFAQGNVSVGASVGLAQGALAGVAARLRYGVPALGRVVVGTLAAAAGTVARRPALQARGVAVCSRGLGALAAVVGARYVQYRRTSSGRARVALAGARAEEGA
ncbi:glycosyltransferase family 2 protein [Cellulomonas shaoxiangyii]|uniref:Glycosyltransferase n=1 Tax=Cellulomonas shaoxiangyii TaxID=2566013 RepID=A0A4P7SMI2_9CELL|nr:glycosyltransferase family 2 protein [Cellulomonas shaoxiangyii]QCB94436.1 glycosyltransferase [Cellulomonas shaoxiangyii]TGY85159.1 glycosyltransferase [Cellulomonas shaoxiangyii]